MTINIKRNSRLRYGTLLNYFGVEYWDLLDLPEIPDNADDIILTLKSTDRLDKLAQSYYGRPELWWVIALKNDIEMNPLQVRRSMEIRIPSPRWVETTLFTDI